MKSAPQVAALALERAVDPCPWYRSVPPGGLDPSAYRVLRDACESSPSPGVATSAALAAVVPADCLARCDLLLRSLPPSRALPAGAAVALALYVSEPSCAARANALLRSSDDVALAWAPFVAGVVRGLRQLPAVRGTYYRAAVARPSDDDAVVCCPSLASALRDPAPLLAWCQRTGGTLYAVETCLAADLGALWPWLAGEVVLEPNAMFEVLASDPGGPGAAPPRVDLAQRPTPLALVPRAAVGPGAACREAVRECTRLLDEGDVEAAVAAVVEALRCEGDCPPALLLLHSVRLTHPLFFPLPHSQACAGLPGALAMTADEALDALRSLPPQRLREGRELVGDVVREAEELRAPWLPTALWLEGYWMFQVSRDYASAIPSLRRGVAGGSPRAQCALGFCLYNGKGEPEDKREGTRLFALSAAQGHPGGVTNLADCSRESGGPQDEAEAVRLYRVAAAQGHARAMLNLGYCYDRGAGVRQDMRVAAGLYKLAADQGNLQALFNLAVSHERGEGVPRDFEAAARLYAIAAAKGHASSQCNLGVLYRRGQGVPVDLARAVQLYALSAAQEDVQAMYNLAVLCSAGVGTDQDAREAVRLLRRAVAVAQHQNSRALLAKFRASTPPPTPPQG
eukprot:m51a1_g4718 hypothetical protein (627) ;mRNA; r:316002-318595